MRILVGSRDRTSDLGKQVQEGARLLMAGGRAGTVPLEVQSVSWRLSRNDEEYRLHVARLMGEWYGLHCVPADIPGRPGQFRGRLIRLGLVLRKLFCGPQH